MGCFPSGIGNPLGAATDVLSGGVTSLPNIAGGLMGTTPDYALEARLANQNTQRQIDSGLSMINAVYGGGNSTQYSPVSGGYYNPATQYYQINPSSGAYQPFTAPKSWTGTTRLPSKVYGPTQLGPQGGHGMVYNNLYTLSNSPSYKGYAQLPQQYSNAYMAAEQPVVAGQAKSASDQLTYDLANRGLVGSSAATTENTGFQTAEQQAEQGLVNNASAGAQSLANSIEASKQAAVADLYQTANPGKALQSSISSAASFQPPSTFAPIADAFSNFINQYYQNQVRSALNSQQLSGTPISYGGYNPLTFTSGSADFIPSNG